MDCKTITIFSNKGGVGKTFVTVNLATSLAMAGSKVLMIDLDFQAGNDMARMLNISPRFTVVDMFAELDKEDKEGLVQRFASQHQLLHCSLFQRRMLPLGQTRAIARLGQTWNYWHITA